MKKIFLLTLILSINLFAQQKPFAYWHSAWTNTAQLPANWTATAAGATEDILVDATIFYRTPVDFDSILVVAKIGSAPANRLDGVQLYKGVDTTSVQAAVFTDASFTDQSLVYASIYLRSTDGNWSNAKTDTAFFGTATELNTPVMALTSGAGTITVSLPTVDANADSAIVTFSSDENYTFAFYNGYIPKDTVVPIGSFPFTFHGRYWDEMWRFQVKVFNDVDTSDVTALDSIAAVATLGDTIYYSSSSSGSGTGADTNNVKAFTIAGFLTDLNAATPGDHFLFKRGTKIAPSSGSELILFQNASTMAGTFANPIVIKDWGNPALPNPVLSCSLMSGNQAVVIGRASHVTFQNIDFEGGGIYFDVQQSNSVNQVRIIDCNIDSVGTKYHCGIIGWTNSAWVDRDSMVWGHIDSVTIRGCTIIGSDEDAIGQTTLGGRGHYVTRNVVMNVGEDGIDYGRGENCLVEYNTIRNCVANGIKMMAQVWKNDHPIVRFNTVLDVNNYSLTIRTTTNGEYYNNTFDNISFGLPGETSILDYDFGGAYLDSIGGVPNPFKGIGNKFYNNVLLGGGVIAFEGGNNVFIQYPPPSTGDTLTASWGYVDNGQVYLNYSSFYSNLIRSDWGDGIVGRCWYNGSIEYTGVPDAQIFTSSGFSEYTWASRGTPVTSFGDSYPNGWYDNLEQLNAMVVDSVYVNANDRGDLRLMDYSPALYAGYNVNCRYDITWAVLPDTGVSMGAYQNPYLEVEDHFTYNFTWENQDFLVQRNGIKNLSIDVSSGVTEYDSVVMNIYKNNSLFMTDNNALSYSSGLATTTLSINVPADTCNYAVTFRRDGVTLDSATFWVGDAYLFSGQSNARQDVTGYDDSLDVNNFKSKWFMTSTGSGWITAETTVINNIGTSQNILADSTVTELGRPCAIINGAVGGTSIKQHLLGQTYFNELKNSVRNVRQHINGFTKFYWWQGETEDDSVFTTYAMYFGAMRTAQKDSMGVDTITIVQLAMHNCLYMEGKTFQLQRRIANSYPDVQIIGTSHFNKFIDDCHFTFQEYKNIGTWLYRLNNSSGYSNPIITDAEYNPVTGILDLTFDQDVIYPADSSGRSLDDFWIIDGDSLMVTSAESNDNIVSLTISGAPAEVSTVGLLRTYRWYSDNNYYRYPFLKNTNGTGVILFDSVAVTTLDGIVMSPPSQFIATFGSNSSLRFEGTFDADTDTVRINGKRVSSPTNAYEDSTYLLRLSSGVLDTTITGLWYNDTTYYFRCSTIGDSSGTSVTTFALDTAVVPAAGGGGENLVATGQGEFESAGTDANFNLQGATTIERSTEQAKNGTYSLKITQTDPDEYFYTMLESGWLTENMAPTTDYRMTVWVYVVSGTLQLRHVDNGNYSLMGDITTTGSWQQIVFDWTTGTDTSGEFWYSPNTNAVFHLDGITVEEL